MQMKKIEKYALIYGVSNFTEFAAQILALALAVNKYPEIATLIFVVSAARRSCFLLGQRHDNGLTTVSPVNVRGDANTSIEDFVYRGYPKSQ